MEQQMVAWVLAIEHHLVDAIDIALHVHGLTEDLGRFRQQYGCMARQQWLQQLIPDLIGVLFDVVYLGFAKMEQGAKLFLCPLDKLAQGPFLKDPLGGFDDFFQPLTVALQGADITIGSQAGPQQCAQLLGS